MFKFVGGRPAVLTFEQVEALYYASFVKRFPGSVVSISQWRGSYEYQCIYADIQMLVENGAIMSDSLDEVMNTIKEENIAIYRPAALMTRVPERFEQAGMIATIRAPDMTNKGILALCVDAKGQTNQTIGELIRDELLPAGQLMEGDIAYQTALSNGQAITILWTAPVDLIASFKVTLTRSRNSPHPTDTPDVIIEKFQAEYARRMGLGMDITPDLYLSPIMVPWASSILIECDPLGNTAFVPGVVPVSFNQRYAAELLPENVVIL